MDRELSLTLEGAGVRPRSASPPRKQREFGETLAAFFLAVAVVMLVAHGCSGWLAVKIAQPRVMGEVVAGIALGPTVLGCVAPDLQAALFPKDIIPVRSGWWPTSA